MTTHTPGPWAAYPAAVKGLGGWRVLNGEVDTAHVYTEANARLIAAAPDLLAALKALLAYEDEPEAGFLNGDIIQARAAIQKAEGGDNGR